MALFPCAYDGAHYRGRSTAAYIAFGFGSDMTRRRYRLCTPHREHLVQQLLPFVREVDSIQDTLVGSDWSKCRHCGGVTEEAGAVFVTCYDADQERTDYWGRLCAACLEDAVGELPAEH